jgi:hypothetical protein
MNPKPPELVADLDWEPKCSGKLCELCAERNNKTSEADGAEVLEEIEKRLFPIIIRGYNDIDHEKAEILEALANAQPFKREFLSIVREVMGNKERNYEEPPRR